MNRGTRALGTIAVMLLGWPALAQQSSFVPVTPCRVVDTRNPAGALAGPALAPRSPRTFPIADSTCLPPGASAMAYAVNVTIVPPGATPGKLNLNSPVGFVTVWPSGQPMPVASTINSWLGTVAANFAIVQAGFAGALDVYSTDKTDIIIDLAGYFTPIPANTVTYGRGLMSVTMPGPDGGQSVEVLVDSTVYPIPGKP